MRKSIIFFACMTLGIPACNKNRQHVRTAADQSLPASADAQRNQETDKVEQQVADGEMEELLLSLKRVHFPFDSSTLSPSGREALKDVANKLKAHPEVDLYVDGHTDKRGTTEYNLSLGDRRAQAVVDYLERLGVAGSRLRRVSFGEEDPLVTGAGQIVYAKNRRVGFRLMHGDVELILKQGTLLDDSGNPIHKPLARMDH